jgi:ribosomal protein L1
MWGDEVARRVSEKHGLEVEFRIDTESGFFTTFDSTGMDDEQLINETMKRVDAINEAREMFFNKELENEFLASKGIEVERKRSRRRRVSRG